MSSYGTKILNAFFVAPKLDSTVSYMHLSIEHVSNVKKPVMYYTEIFKKGEKNLAIS